MFYNQTNTELEPTEMTQLLDQAEIIFSFTTGDATNTFSYILQST